MVNCLELHDFSTAPFRLRKTEGNTVLSRVRRFNFVHPVDLLSLALRLGCLGVFRSKPIDESLKFFDLPLLVFVGGQNLLLPGRFLYDVFIVVAAVGDQFVLIDLDGPFSECVQERPVVRDQQNRPRVGKKIVLQPNERFQVEMVGGFIKKKQVRLDNQESREMRAHNPPAAHRLGQPGIISFPESQPFEDSLGLRFDLLEISGKRTIRVRQFPIFRSWTDRQRRSGHFQYSFVTHRCAFLRKKPNFDPALQSHFTSVGFVQLQ
jgi:hypothetical protein